MAKAKISISQLTYILRCLQNLSEMIDLLEIGVTFFLREQTGPALDFSPMGLPKLADGQLSIIPVLISECCTWLCKDIEFIWSGLY